MIRIKEDKAPSADAKRPGREQKKKTLYAVLILLVPFLGCMYLIFGGGKDTTEDGRGVNATIPEGRSRQIEASKQRALESVTTQDGQQSRSAAPTGDDYSLTAKPDRSAEPRAQADAAAQARQAQAQASRAVGGFYSAPREDHQVEQLRREVEQLRGSLEEKPMAVPDAMALAEKQYALAAKYFPQAGVQTTSAAVKSSSRDTPVQRVQSAARGVVSSLATAETTVGGERNRGFNTPVGDAATLHSRGIAACVDEDQTLSGGDRIRLRLMEAVRAGECTLPPGTVIYGTAGIAAQRLQVEVESLEYGGEVIPVELRAYDMDGSQGLYVPDSQERTAAKDAAAGVSTALGSSISFARGAEEQVAMDLTRGVLSGGSQYLSSKLRQVKVSVKAGYRLLLISTQ